MPNENKYYFNICFQLQTVEIRKIALGSWNFSKAAVLLLFLGGGGNSTFSSQPKSMKMNLSLVFQVLVLWQRTLTKLKLHKTLHQTKRSLDDKLLQYWPSLAIHWGSRYIRFDVQAEQHNEHLTVEDLMIF